MAVTVDLDEGPTVTVTDVVAVVAVDEDDNEDEGMVEGLESFRDSARDTVLGLKGPGLDSISPDLFSKSLFEKVVAHPNPQPS